MNTEKKSAALYKFYGLLVFLLAIVSGLYYWGWSIDDPWIAYRYAGNLAAGNGLVFNVGERLESYTSLFIILILSVFIKSGIEPDLPCRLIGLLSHGATASLMIFFAAKFFKTRNPFLLMSGAFLYAVNPSAALWSVGGLETNLHSLILLAVFILFISEEARPRLSRRIHIRYSFLLMFILSLIRIEAPVIFVALIFYIIFKAALQRRFPEKSEVAGVMLFIIPYAIYTLWRIIYFGELLPNTFYAKVTGEKAEQFKTGIKYTLGFIKYNGGMLYFLLIIAAADLLFRLKNIIFVNFIHSAKQAREKNEKTDFIVKFRLTCYFIIFWYLFFIIYSGGDWMPLYRFFVHILPIILLSLQEALIFVSDAIKQRITDKEMRKVLYGLIALAFLAEVSFLAILNYRETRQIVERTILGTYHQQYFYVSDYIKKIAHQGDLLAGEEAGIIPYETKLPFIDMIGLLDKHISHKSGKLHYKTDSEYVLSLKPRFILIHADIKSSPDNFIGTYPTGQDMFANPEFLSSYKLIKTFIRGDDKYYKNYFMLFQKRES